MIDRWAESTFRRMDTNGDGLLNYDEMSESLRAERDKWDIVSWAVEPGDILIFHTAMLHGGGPTHLGQRRRTLSLRFFGDDAIYTPRLPAILSESSQEVFPANDDASASTLAKLPRALSPGDPFRHPEFLKLRPRG